MSKESIRSLKPFLSILFVIFTLLGVVFVKMEERRLGYLMLKQNRVYRKIRDLNRRQVMEYAKVTRPERVRELALTRLTMNDPRSGQIIQLTGDNVAVAH